MMQEVKNTANTVILVSSGTISGRRSRQVAQSELYARSLARFGGIMLLDGGFGSVEEIMEVSGIGEGKFAALEGRITVEDTK